MMKRLLFIFILVFLCSVNVLDAKTHVFREGDTLWELAAQHYGDPTLYPILLEVNGIDNPRTIQNGKVIVIPDKADMRRIAEERDPDRRRELLARAAGSEGKNEEKPDQNTPVVAPSGADAVSRTGDAIDPEETGFSKILGGPKVSGDKLIKTTVP